MSLTDLMAAVRTEVRAAADRDTLLQIAAERLACRQCGQAELLASLREREALCSTALGHGIAIPHGRAPGLEQPRGILIRLQTPADFNGEPVDLAFAMAVPSHYTHEHLALLAELVERFNDEAFRQALRRAPDADALLALLLRPHAQAQAA
ncbi:PTS fructose transporter subunit IIA [Stenotrophomonas panacihumi]|uniref:PTS fructose transporter subunit IIA n=1 Tax=Stenotrophomonas panacihumi TaxID=676599 RepID=A0A0R0B033_9GAMM|nr:PTS sugar transporter subunit IIA [Stenotrophomonas panacihumi]KRG46948.1 PTS fructose transporter subunit IIA [Stenotrophomonas panacihumi]PTN54214.1 PTS fructose transporter subunit IIA [Stenotrophomonas panacihumi]